ncbi:MAG: hypothetical protein KKB30_08050 [Proteobacteria bacterium]|nr:hypothetical protein [Pseudomonadota bacterium]MBU1714771.1 hypothetical protein [Pseudomonadota bacterium]
MEIYCDSCNQTVGQIADDKIPLNKSVSAKCPNCGDKIIFTRKEEKSKSFDADFQDTVIMNSDTIPGIGQDTLQEKITGQKRSPQEERAVTKPRDFAVMEVIKEAWQKTSGAKGSIWAAYAIICFGMFVVVFGVQVLAGLAGAADNLAITGAIQVTVNAAMYPFLAGIMMMGIYKAVDRPINFKMAFGYFSLLIPIVVGGFLMTIITVLGFILLFVPGIYLAISYSMTIPLIVEKGMGPWEAMETSRKAVSKHWFRVFGVNIMMGIILMISSIPMGLGIIWTMPMFFVTTGILYRNIIGVEAESSVSV